MKNSKRVVPIRRKEEDNGGQEEAGAFWSPEARLTQIRSLIDSVMKTLDTEKPKATVGDLIRLLQIEDDLVGKRPKDVTVQWIESKRG